MAFKPYCTECESWHWPKEKHVMSMGERIAQLEREKDPNYLLGVAEHDRKRAIETLEWIADAAMSALRGKTDETHVLSQINNIARAAIDCLRGN